MRPSAAHPRRAYRERGPSNDPGVFRNKTATDEFVAETVAGAEYLKGICGDLGIRVE